MKENNLSFDITPISSYRRTIESIKTVNYLNGITVLTVDSDIDFISNFDNVTRTNKVTIALQELIDFINDKANSLIYDKAELDEDDKRFVGFVHYTFGYSYDKYVEIIGEILNKATIVFDIVNIKRNTGYRYNQYVTVIKDILLDEDVFNQITSRF